MRYYVSLMAFGIGAALIGVYFVVLYMLEEKSCIIPQILEEKFPFTFWLLDLFVKTERFCMNRDDSWLTIEHDESILWVLISGIVMASAGATFWILMNFCVPKKETGTMDKIKSKFRRTKRKKCCGCFEVNYKKKGTGIEIQSIAV